ncbi:hypothetical protein NADFUDRAFT_81574 [Nadsonia fulvescens var. elongata DSM 6958]|uniref:Gpi16 subunit, GPI transamidase component n=1 Tax=Nadsonia fulvescens var. elongata DSM 6958 TaxID=857566 RepID=A0A1E3PNQ2_9ASCO|nr:hypothetical protein NADFUDRAFT_81574 [Nadsonia fulvescens var. elongata DSM 6958]
MSIDVATVCNLDTQDCRLRMTQVIDMVIDVPRAIKKKDSPIPVPTPVSELRCDKSKSYYNERNCFPLDEPTEVAWKLSDFFGRPISGACSVALQNGQICSKVPENWELSYDYANDIELAHLEDNCINLPNRLPNSDNHFDLTLSTYNADQVLEIPTPPVYVQRSLTGHGQEHGGVRTVFRNPSLTKSVRLVYFETIPWFMRFFIHTLDVSGTKDTTISLSRKELIQNIHYTPALDRSRPAQFEVEIIIPSGVTAVLSYQFDKSLLFLEEYPPDANFGFYIAPAVLTTIEDGHDRPCTIRTTSLLLSLPTPDFSMPYNVIILTCTVMALTFGSIYNILVKRIVTVAEAEAVMKNTQSYKFIQKAKNFKVALKNLGKKAKEE